ncbi:sigma-70 family RNA polymerase sigma factor [Solimonas flava]|uniref:sigma-70 family RNA polymerase sigma factor n=1 Tax=Solimonas flava TaxID=415849 RepID=UPI000428140E|nr:sigma-70 family RNA polymerase sigma factor [Solimonas flava]
MIDDDELRELLPALRRFALGLARDAGDADDLVQACLERALSRWRTRRPDGELRAWLFSILYRQFVDAQRRSRRWRRVFEPYVGDEPGALAPSAEDTVLAQDALAALGRLPAEQRALLLMVAVEGLAYQEAADALGVPIGTVMSRLSRARQRYRELMDGGPLRPALRRVK